jgi:hypothetical protein
MDAALSRHKIAISRASTISRVAKAEVFGGLETAYTKLKDDLPETDHEWLDAAYVHHEVVMKSNENISLSQDRSTSNIRSDIVDNSKLGPVIILISQEDGLTTNTTRMASLFRQKTLP